MFSGLLVTLFFALSLFLFHILQFIPPRAQSLRTENIDEITLVIKPSAPVL